MSNNQRDIYSLLLEAESRKNKQKREEMLCNVGIIEEYFEEGSIKIDHSTCRGVECKLCIEACPTSALFRVEGKVEVERDLCIYCTSCVLSCIVDNCIIVTRKRQNKEVEEFGTPRDVILLLSKTASNKRIEVLKKRILAKLSSRKYY